VRAQHAVRQVHTSETLLDYVQALTRRTRERTDLKLGLSPRAAQGLLHAAQAWAYLHARAGVLPEDVQAVLPAVVAHRLELSEPVAFADRSRLAAELIESVPVPA